MPDLLVRPDINVRSTRYFIASTGVTCWHCHASTRLIALGLPPGHQTLDLDDDEEPTPTPEAAPNRPGQRTAAGTANGSAEGTQDTEGTGGAPQGSTELTQGPAELRQGLAELKGGQPTTTRSESTWRIANHNALLFYVDYFPEIIRSRLQQLAKSYRFGYCEATASSYWANHCELCDSLLDDHELFCEPEGAFLPTSAATAALIHLLPIEESIEAAAAGYAFEPAFFDAMTPESQAMPPEAQGMTSESQALTSEPQGMTAGSQAMTQGR